MEYNCLSFLAPKSIVGTCVCSALIGFIYLLALLFVIPDMNTFMEVNSNSSNNEQLNLAVATFELALPHRGALALTIILLINLYFAGMSSTTVTSRIG
jgi:amino acid transporter